ncbi:MAG: hypothetical protein JO353_12700 [Phycisphaerae bacterium]|nr:hypothetical protein [Phycisphaerae bacterium]
MKNETVRRSANLDLRGGKPSPTTANSPGPWRTGIVELNPFCQQFQGAFWSVSRMTGIMAAMIRFSI